MKLQNLDQLELEMREVARGEKPAPADAREMTINSVEALARLLTPENRVLLATIRDRKPGSIAELAEMSGRAASNLNRTLEKLEAAGLVRLEGQGRRKVPVPGIRRIHIDIDPYSTDDRMEFA
jgi:predicted transcriptional regulator